VGEYALMQQRLSAFFTGDGVAAALVRPVAGNGLVRVIGILASFTVGVQLARGLGVTSYGYYSIALAVITLSGIPSEFGLPTLVTREVAAASVHHDRNELFAIIRWAERSCRWIAFGIMTAVVTAALLLRSAYAPTITECLLIGAPIIPLMALSRVRSGAIQGLNHVVRAQIPEGLVRPVFFSSILALVYVLHVKLSPQLAMGLYSVTIAVILIFSSVWLRHVLPGRPAEPLPTRKRSIASSIPMGLMEGMRVIQGEVSIVLAGLVAAPAVVGLLRIANVTAMTAAVPLVIMVQVGMPMMAKLYASGDRARLQKTVTALAQTQFAGVVLLSLPLLAFPAPLLSLAFGPSFAAASEALRVLMLAQLANAAFGPNIWLLNMTHHERRVLRALGAALVINSIAVPLLAAKWGATGASFALFGSMLCWNIISWRDAKNLLGIETSIIHWPWRVRARPT
jgi:O-antigen/teichoic acid export membrane protein